MTCSKLWTDRAIISRRPTWREPECSSRVGDIFIFTQTYVNMCNCAVKSTKCHRLSCLQPGPRPRAGGNCSLLSYPVIFGRPEAQRTLGLYLDKNPRKDSSYSHQWDINIDKGSHTSEIHQLQFKVIVLFFLSVVLLNFSVLSSESPEGTRRLLFERLSDLYGTVLVLPSWSLDQTDLTEEWLNQCVTCAAGFVDTPNYCFMLWRAGMSCSNTCLIPIPLIQRSAWGFVHSASLHSEHNVPSKVTTVEHPAAGLSKLSRVEFNNWHKRRTLHTPFKYRKLQSNFATAMAYTPESTLVELAHRGERECEGLSVSDILALSRV